MRGLLRVLIGSRCVENGGSVSCVCVCVCLFNVRAEHVIKSRVLKAPRGAKDAGGGRPPALKLEASVHVFYGS
jgi:hypothetical protein